MNNSTDSFEKIAADAVDLLMAIIADLVERDEPADQMAGAIISARTENFCDRAIALGGE